MKIQKRLLVAYVLVMFTVFGVVPGVVTPQAEALYSNKKVARICSDVSVISHRGETGSYNGSQHDENTIHAFKGAVKRGANVIETDLRLTKDGVWIIMHDPTLGRTTYGQGRVNAKTLDQIQALKTTHGYNVPTLQKLIKTFADDKSVGFQLELKDAGATTEQLQQVVDLLEANGVLDRVLFTSTLSKNLRRIKELSPTTPTGYIAIGTTRPKLATLLEHKVNYVMIHHTRLTEVYVNRMAGNGIQVSARSATKSSEYKLIVAKGATRVVVDDVKGYNNWCRGL